MSGFFGRNGQYAIQAAAAVHSPADASSHFFGNVPSIAPASVDYYICPIPKSGRIKEVALTIYVAGTLGTTEQSTVYLRKNSTTDTQLITNAQHNTARQDYFIATDIAVVRGDWVAIKIVCPTWVTNPVSVLYAAVIYIEGV